jgi:sortase family protein
MRTTLATMFDRLRTRLVPALLTAAGISLIAAGLLTYSTPVSAEGPDGSGGLVLVTEEPSASPDGLLTLPPLPSLTPSGSTKPVRRVVSRVVIPALGIDLPVMKPPGGFPYCNVAMYLDIFSQPGQPGATYLFAHARTGMFLSLLSQSQRNNGKGMINMIVQVYTTDDLLFFYRVAQVRRHYPASSSLAALPTKDDQLWLQTSEGPLSSSPKLQVVAKLLSNGPADHAAAHPKPHPVVCG